MDITQHEDDPYSWSAYKYDATTDGYSKLENFICWDLTDQIISSYDTEVKALFEKTNVNGGMEIQLMPFQLMDSVLSNFLHPIVDPLSYQFSLMLLNKESIASYR